MERLESRIKELQSAIERMCDECHMGNCHNDFGTPGEEWVCPLADVSSFGWRSDEKWRREA